MNRTTIRATLTACAALAAADPVEPVYDRVTLKTGATVVGVILDESPPGVRMLDVRVRAGRPTVWFQTTVGRDEIAGLHPATAEARAASLQRLRAIAAERAAERAAAVELEPIRPPSPLAGGWAYSSDLFALNCRTTRELARRMAVRLEQVHAAFGRSFPDARMSAVKPSITVFGSVDEYRKFLQGRGVVIRNEACFVAAESAVYGACDLDRLGDDLDRVRERHRKLLDDLDGREAALRKLYKGPELARHLEPFRATRARIANAERANEGIIDDATRRLLRTLTHEAFHAFARSRAFPADDGEDLPAWLDEGLAQIFESAVLEAGEFRLGHAEAERLNRARAVLRRGDWPGLAELVRSRPEAFHLSRPDDAEVSGQYLASWGVTHYLMFGRRSCDAAAVRRYAKSVRGGAGPVEALEAWLGESVESVDRKCRDYLLRLREDGTLAEPNWPTASGSPMNPVPPARRP